MLDALLFGVIQGLSEFLPISSSGHLALAMHLVGWEEPPLVMSLVVHLGTLAAVFAVYGRDLLGAVAGGLRLLVALPKGKARALIAEDRSAALAIWVVLATIPTGAVALLIKGPVEQATESTDVVGSLLLVTGAVLLASRFIPQRQEPLGPWKALGVGVVQGLAVLPGISRSGSTIVAGLGLGLSRDEAARFSFVASVPAILGASILEIDLAVLGRSSESVVSYTVAGVTSLVVAATWRCGC